MACQITLPLEKREKSGSSSSKRQLCLHPQWMFPMKCILYEPAKADMSAADIAEWQDRLQFLVADFRELLSLEYSQFWCQVIFEPTVIPSINSYLKAGPRSHDLNPADVPVECCDLHDELHRLVFLVVLRLSTAKESKADFLTPSVFGDIIYDNYIFDITKLLDVCSLYGQANQKLVTKMIENIFKCQPKYKADLRDWFSVMNEMFDKFREDCKFLMKSGSPQKLGLTTERLSEEEIIDRLLYATDAVSSLDIFLRIASFLAEEFLKNGFEQLIIHLFEDLIPHFEEEMKLCNFKRESNRQLCRRALSRFSEGSLSIYRQIVFPACLGPLVDPETENSLKLVELFANTTLNILGHRRFSAELDYRYPFEEDLDLIRQSGLGSSLDDAQVSFICNAIQSAKEDFSSSKKPSRAAKASRRKQPPRAAPKQTCQAASDPLYEDEPPCPGSQSASGDQSLVGATAQPADLPLLITTVQDIFPDLGAGFVEACLAEFQYSSERVINALLEGPLPTYLNKLDRQLPQKPKAAQKIVRHSVFDGDEFDHKVGKPLDMSRIHQGKRDVDESLSEDFKKALMLQYFYEEHLEDVQPGMEEREYDDEYDDTYESNVIDRDEKDAALYKRPWVLPRALGGGKVAEDSPDNESDKDPESQPANDDAAVSDVINGAQGNQPPRRGRGHRNQPPRREDNPGPGGAMPRNEERRTYDARGQHRGPGQIDDAMRNRQYRDRHKAQRENRRALADRKRQRPGFF